MAGKIFQGRVGIEASAVVGLVTGERGPRPARGKQIQAGDVQRTTQAGEKIRPLRGLEFVILQPGMGRKLLESIARATREDEDGLPNRMLRSAVKEFPVLHGGKEVTQPRQSLLAERGVKLVEEDERNPAFEHLVADKMKGGGQFVGRLVLREVEGQFCDRP